ncbi:MAG: sulfotransferase domain-containing protein [Caldilineaceae bacterium]|nr:sulfotransferase domain-containing protein [Caldilineaceae bacterium]
MTKLIRRLFGVNAQQTNQGIVVVSGLPRSGTSLMMSMLAAGGLPLVTDHLRAADEDNPQGYYEYERVKRLEKGDVAWLAQAQGKAVKVISALLSHLPVQYTYQVIFMARPLAEILASQRKMLARRQPNAVDAVDDDEMALLLQNHLEETQSWLARQSNMTTLYIPYQDLLATPHAQVARIGAFVPTQLDLAAMAAVVEPALYRNRAES